MSVNDVNISDDAGLFPRWMDNSVNSKLRGTPLFSDRGVEGFLCVAILVQGGISAQTSYCSSESLSRILSVRFVLSLECVCAFVVLVGLPRAVGRVNGVFWQGSDAGRSWKAPTVDHWEALNL